MVVASIFSYVLVQPKQGHPCLTLPKEYKKTTKRCKTTTNTCWRTSKRCRKSLLICRSGRRLSTRQCPGALSHNTCISGINIVLLITFFARPSCYFYFPFSVLAFLVLMLPLPYVIVCAISRTNKIPISSPWAHVKLKWKPSLIPLWDQYFPLLVCGIAL